MKWFRVFMRNTDKEKIECLEETVKELFSIINYWKKSRSELDEFASDIIKTQSDDMVNLKIKYRIVSEELKRFQSIEKQECIHEKKCSELLSGCICFSRCSKFESKV